MLMQHILLPSLITFSFPRRDNYLDARNIINLKLIFFAASNRLHSAVSGNGSKLNGLSVSVSVNSCM